MAENPIAVPKQVTETGKNPAVNVDTKKGKEGQKANGETGPIDQEAKSLAAKAAEKARNLGAKLKSVFKSNPNNAGNDLNDLAKGKYDSVPDFVANTPLDITKPQSESASDQTTQNNVAGEFANTADVAEAANSKSPKELILTSDQIAALEPHKVTGPITVGEDLPRRASDLAQELQQTPGELGPDGVTINPTVEDALTQHKNEVAALKKPGRLSTMLPGGTRRQLAYDQQRQESQARYAQKVIETRSINKELIHKQNKILKLA
jgi:hypothetical protein